MWNEDVGMGSADSRHHREDLLKPLLEEKDVEVQKQRLLACLVDACHYEEGVKSEPAKGNKKAVIGYFENRQITNEAIDHFRLGYFGVRALRWMQHLRLAYPDLSNLLEDDLGIVSVFRERLIFPVRDAQGVIVGIGGRADPDRMKHTNFKFPKYINSKFPKKNMLFGLAEARDAIWSAGEAFVTEGYFDVISAWQGGVPNVCGVMQATMGAWQIQQLARYTDRFLLVMDNDKAGREGSARTVELIRKSFSDIDVQEVFLTDDVKDWDEYRVKYGSAVFDLKLPVRRGSREEMASKRDKLQEVGNAAERSVPTST